MAAMLPTIGQQNQMAAQQAYLQQQQQYAAQHGLAVGIASPVDDNACCGCSGDTCACFNKFFMGLAALLALGGAILVWIGGIAPYNLSLDQALVDCPNTGGQTTCFGLTQFISCNDQYRQVWANPSATNSSYAPYNQGRFANPNLQYLAWAQCAAPQAPMVLLSAFTGFMVVWLGISGVYAAFSGSRTAAFSSGISIAWTTALIIVNVVISLYSFAPSAAKFMDCSPFKGNDAANFNSLNGICLSGQPAAASPQAPGLKTIMNWGMAVACFYVGAALTLACLMLLKYTTTNTFHRGTRDKQVATLV